MLRQGYGSGGSNQIMAVGAVKAEYFFPLPDFENSFTASFASVTALITNASPSSVLRLKCLENPAILA